jgi:tRNA (cmo5U34)-methyltransferase
MTEERSIKATFDAAARDYDSLRRRLIPCFDDFYGMAISLVPYRPGDAFNVLDLGAGTGLLAALIRESFPRARLTLVDISDEMLERARERFAGPEGVRLIVADYASEPLPGRFGLVVSALSIHHLTDDAKRDLFGRIFEALHPGGAFINADEVCGPTDDLDRFYKAEWRRRVIELGVTQEQLDGAEGRMEHDLPATLDDQLAWLREADFVHVDCFYRNLMFAVFGGRRPG